jgi:hypothetical protein
MHKHSLCFTEWLSTNGYNCIILHVITNICINDTIVHIIVLWQSCIYFVNTTCESQLYGKCSSTTSSNTRLSTWWKLPISWSIDNSATSAMGGAIKLATQIHTYIRHTHKPPPSNCSKLDKNISYAPILSYEENYEINFKKVPLRCARDERQKRTLIEKVLYLLRPTTN